jgi:hypothetical protein
MNVGETFRGNREAAVKTGGIVLTVLLVPLAV